jgi:uncharacterized repeat protein (TIGR02543 family)
MNKYYILLFLLTSCTNLSTKQYDLNDNNNLNTNIYSITLFDEDHTLLQVLYFNENDSVKLPKLYKDNYDFLGWTTSDIKALDVSGYLSKYKIEYMPKYNIKLYAIWAENTFSIINKFKKIVNDEKQDFKTQFFISVETDMKSYVTKTNISVSFPQTSGYELSYENVFLGSTLKNQKKFEINSSFIYTNSVIASYYENTYINNKLTESTIVLIKGIKFISPQKYDISYSIIRNQHYIDTNLMLEAINQTIFNSYYGIKYKLQDDYQIYYTERIFFGDVIFDSLI